MKFIVKVKEFLIISFLASTFFYGCKGNEIYPIVPSIVYKDAYVFFDTSNTAYVFVSFTYKDGDGDIGLDASQNAPPYNTDTLGPNFSNSNRFANNVWIDYYQKKDGVYTQAVNPLSIYDTIREDVRIGNLTPDGSNKAIRGEIQLQQINTVPRISSNYSDTIKLKLRLVDRALNISNEIETPDLYLTR